MAGPEGLQLDTTPVTLYMEKLKKQLEDAAEKAKLISTIQQEKMAHHYNLRSTKKIFNPGDKVIVLIPDSKNKLLARWQGPCIIEARRNEHSFVVKMPDASVRHVHQNKMREFVASSGSVNVIFRSRMEEFGDVESTPLIGDSFCQEIKSITSSDLSATQRNELETMLKEFEPLFSRPVQPVAIGEHVIELLPNVTRQKPHSYSVPISYKKEVDRQVKELLDLDLIEPSNADVTYPIVCVAKKDASIRMCIDYRALNAVTKVPNYPMKDTQELIFTAGMAQWLSCLDLLKGYYQIKMHDENRVLTTFSTHNGVYQWKVMPFGLSGASGTFQKIMNNVLRSHSSYAQAYIDDIIVYSKTWDEHLIHLRNVLQELENAGFSVKLRKCTFAAKELQFLGHKIGGGKHAPDEEKIAAIKRLERPKTKKDVRSVLGLMGFYRSYIPNYAEFATPLTELTKGKKSGDVKWAKREEE
ncbi:Transposon Ty3-I Gag-Pol polyprotein [Araneus ventricosus]|uniref:Transposon Ty3-I Gag-Pol polyprotein n=1 Tax=Araneus ventricosus TaxID=182803 RepID=A0A4Y2R7X4_ARAVE|nr:Transposon Ty3-I Gag-Pol polyprotein [Araneus ventricosus]GBN71876.1 Transposon Ty3-I Gag-Pol polyprotein [Araneus ventricosus]